MRNGFWNSVQAIVLATILAMGLFLQACDSRSSNVAVLSRDTPTPAPTMDAIPTNSPVESAPVQSPEFTPTPFASLTPIPTPTVQPTPFVNNSEETKNESNSRPDSLMIPVVGIKRSDLRDTFTDSRSEGRKHDAIDIMAQRGTPIVAAADGEIARFFDSDKGGITIYQFSADKKLIYYYAHLERRADNLQPAQFVKQGTILGYVGDSGNAGAGNCHLHFAIWTVDDPKRYWDGTNLNPYPLLKEARESRLPQ